MQSSAGVSSKNMTTLTSGRIDLHPHPEARKYSILPIYDLFGLVLQLSSTFFVVFGQVLNIV